MKKRIAINGFGRIGRLMFRSLFNSEKVEIIAINNPGDISGAAHLLEYDSAQGIWMKDKIEVKDGKLIVDGKETLVFGEREPKALPWKEHKIDIVIESTGVFREINKAKMHIEAGAKKVIISAPGQGEMKTVVYNVNHDQLDGSEEVFSGASCTTNCLAPVVKVLNDEFGIHQGFMTTVHAYTNDQNTVDARHSDLRRARAAAQNIIPTTTGAAVAVGKVLPELKGKLDGIAMRVPIVTGSAVDLVVKLDKKVTVEDVNNAFKKASNSSFEYSTKPLVSTDIIGATAGSILDSQMTKVIETENGQLVKVVAWYDNEMSYVWQLIRTTEHFATIMQ